MGYPSEHDFMKSTKNLVWYAPWLYSKNDNYFEVIQIEDLKEIIENCYRYIPPTCPVKKLLKIE